LVFDISQEYVDLAKKRIIFDYSDYRNKAQEWNITKNNLFSNSELEEEYEPLAKAV